MSDQGAAPHHRPEDGWWHSVYTGPEGTLPDTPGAVADTATVDDWFASAAGLIGPQRTAPPAQPAPSIPGQTDTPPPPARPQPADSPPAGTGWATWIDGEPPARPEPPAVPGPPAVPRPSVPEEPPAVPTSPALPKASLTPEPPAVPAPAVPPAPTVPGPPAEPRLSAGAALRRGLGEVPVPHVGERPPTYGPEPTALPASDPEWLGGLVPDTALEGAQYGSATLRAASVRGDSARYRGEPRRDALLTVRFGDGPDGLLLAVLAAPPRETEAGQGAAAAADAARLLAVAIGRSRAELAADLRAGARDRLRYGLQRIATQAAAPLRVLGGPVTDLPDRIGASGEWVPDRAGPHSGGPSVSSSNAGEPSAGGPTAGGPDSGGPEDDGAERELGEVGSLHCLLVSLDPAATHRAAFGTGPGGLYLLRSGHWIDAYAARLLHHPDGEPPIVPTGSVVPRPFRFRLVPATPGDILLLCTPGLAAPIAEEPAVAHFLSNHWAHPHPPGTVDFLRQVQVRAKGYADDRTAAALWTE